MRGLTSAIFAAAAALGLAACSPATTGAGPAFLGQGGPTPVLLGGEGLDAAQASDGSHEAAPAFIGFPGPRLGWQLGNGVTIYSASWCGPCKTLKARLHEKEIPYDEVDVDKNQEAYARAQKSAGNARGIPLTNVVHDGDSSWFVGDNAEPIERAYRGR